MKAGPLSAPVVEVSELSLAYGGQKVLDVPSLQVFGNEVLTIVGPNGCGKTTLLLCLSLLLKPSTGVVSYHGSRVVDDSTALRLRRKMSVAFQDPLLVNGSVWDNVTLGLRLRGIRDHRAKERAETWLERFGVAHLAKRQARTLSGGEAKRVSLARAFVLDPEVLFLDEPFNALDSPTRQGLMEDFESVLRETRVTTVMVTHDRNEALALAHRVAVMMAGRIRQLAPTDEVFSSPVDEEVARFVEAGNILQGMVSSQNNGLACVAIDGGEVQAVSNLSLGTRVIGYLHYEDVTLTLNASPDTLSSARNQLRARITKSFAVGPQIKVTMECGFVLASLVTRRSWEEMGLEIGKEVVASFKASSVHLVPKL